MPLRPIAPPWQAPAFLHKLHMAVDKNPPFYHGAAIYNNATKCLHYNVRFFFAHVSLPSLCHHYNVEDL
ncbi:hypothetical protein A2U01_0021849, partial [Trifolium medium]|nr:hypothetical protein [Trifolium medium]